MIGATKPAAQWERRLCADKFLFLVENRKNPEFFRTFSAKKLSDRNFLRESIDFSAKRYIIIMITAFFSQKTRRNKVTRFFVYRQIGFLLSFFGKTVF